MPRSSAAAPVLATPLATAALLAALTSALPAQQPVAPIGFEETYALSPDRAKAVASLLPGTEDHFYWLCRERLTARDFPTVRTLLPRWIQAHGRTARVLEIENREALLSAGDDPARTFALLRERLRPNLDHQPVIPGTPSSLPTRLDPQLLAPAAIRARGLQTAPESVGGFRPEALVDLVGSELTPAQRRSLLQSLPRVDVPGLVDVVLQDLREPDSGGFGSLPIHRLLLRDQLEACAQAMPELLANDGFVRAALAHRRPNSDEDVATDAVARAAYLDRLWQFARRLPPAMQSVQANVLFHRLQHDLGQGTVDRERLLAYLQLPRPFGYVRQTLLEQAQRTVGLVDVGTSWLGDLGAIGDDEAVVRASLEALFATSDDPRSFAPFLDADWLRRVFAETKLLLGQGDAAQWTAQLGDPSYVEALRSRVELGFAPTQQRTFGGDEAVSLVVDTKNVATLLVQVFAIDADRYLRDGTGEVPLDLPLDGVSPTHANTLRFPEPALQRVRRTLPLPELAGPGTWIVELVGNGVRSRALIRKGSLSAVSRVTSAGHEFTVFDEQRTQRKDAVVWFGGREYTADESGTILLPFSTAEGAHPVVLRAGARVARHTFQHRAEAYLLESAVFVDRGELRAGGTAHVVVRPSLRVADHPASVTLLKDVVLTITATDLDGIATVQEVKIDALADAREFVHELTVPQRLQRLVFDLAGKAKSLSGPDVAIAATPTTIDMNGIDQGPATRSVMLRSGPDGHWLEVRGKNGEPRAGVRVAVALHHEDLAAPIPVELQSDAAGRVGLGPLPGVDALTVQDGDGQPVALRGLGCTWPRHVHGVAGTTLRLPYDGADATPTRRQFSLSGEGRDEFARLRIADGCVELRELPAGDYQLVDHRAGRVVAVRITAATTAGRWLVGPRGILQASANQPLCVRSQSLDDTGLQVTLAGASSSARVHVIASTHPPTLDPFVALRPSRQALVRNENRALAGQFANGVRLGDEYRYVLERRQATRFPGNMLERPSLLLHPWALTDSNSSRQEALEGTDWNSAFGTTGNAGAPTSTTVGRDAPSVRNFGTFTNLDWLPHGSTVLTNLTPDADGVVRVATKDLGPGGVIQVLVIDGDQAVRSELVRGVADVPSRPRVLPKSLDATQHLAEQKRIEFVAAGTSITIDGTQGVQVELFDTIGAALRLLTSVSQDQDLARFAFVADWPTFDDGRKRQLYDQHACHELHLFLFHKDPAFFAAVVKPLLANKLDKTFVDHWLLGSDLKRYLEPWTFAQLNLVERVLLTRRLAGDDLALLQQNLREAHELRPVAPQRLDLLLRTALQANQLAAGQTPALLGFFVRDTAAVDDLGPADGGRSKGKADDPDALRLAEPSQDRAAGEKESDEQHRFRGLAKRKDSKEAEDAQDEAKKRQEEPEALEQAAHGLAQLGDQAEDLRRDSARRGFYKQLYRAVAATKLLVESNWWHRRLEQTTADVVAPNRFWVDYATAPANQPFASPHLIEASTSFLEMMAALAVLDLPFAAGKHEVTSDGNARTLKAATPLLLVRKEVQKTEPAADQQPLLLGQNFFRLDDRYRFENGERRDAFVTGEFVVDTAYGCQVVVTNPTSSNRTADVLLQIPAGALPLQKGFWTKGHSVELAPYATATIEYAFYFPAAGDFAHYPAHAAEKGHLAAHAEPRTLHVVTVPTTIDTRSWDHVSQQGSPQDVLAFLDQHNVQRLELARIAWRMKDREFFTMALAKLRARHVYDDTLWSYALLHRDAAACGEYLRHQEQFLGQCGMAIDSPLLRFEPKERRQYQHLELDPLVHPRAHPLGGQRVLGNQDLARQYSQLMTLLGYHDTLSSDDWLVVSYYLLLQDRIEEGLAAFGKVDAAQVAARVQYDYLAAYTCFFTGDTAKAKELATRHKDHPVPHWQQRFQAVLAQLDEAAGGTSQPTGEPVADAVAKAAALELGVSGRTLTIAHKNVAQCEVRYYELDVEFAFSAMPFQNQGGTSAAYVQPTFAETKDLPKDQAQLAFELPQRFHQKNVLVEVRAQGLVRSVQYFANDLAVRFLENFGQVVVTTADGKTPLPKAYVKVFARLPGGTVRFHKDGYTDLRGRFDYASLSDDPNLQAERYAVLVLDERRGAVIREIAPPAR
ncbi:MAG: hypothetical protein U1F60_10600 [Planctomycetota bacterium]